MSLIYKDRVFDACKCIEDVAAVKVDPTGTRAIRKAFFSSLAIKWRRVRVAIRAGVLDVDVLGLKAGASLAQSAAAAGGATKIQIFQRWIDSILQGNVIENDTQGALPYVQKAYAAGAELGQRVLGKVAPIAPNDRVAAIAALAHVELQGIVEAVSQNAVRAAANGLLNGSSANKILRAILAAVDSIGVVRSKTMVELLVVKAFGDGTLDAYESAGVGSVGLVPESKRTKRQVGDALVQDLRRATGPGSRVPRSRTPSLRTIQRIRAVERTFSGVGRVNVQTAEDDQVCPICESISEHGPYRINAARSLIPAHPHCRCIFVPAEGTFEEDED